MNSSTASRRRAGVVVRKYHGVLGLCLEYIEAVVVVPVGGRTCRVVGSRED